MLPFAFCLPLVTSAKELKRNQNFFLYTVSQSFQSTSSASSLEAAINVVKHTYEYVYVPYLGIFLQHTYLDQSLVTNNPDDAGVPVAASAMGIRAGVSFPTEIFNSTLAWHFNLTYARTSVQSDPWFGRPENNLNASPLFQVVVGPRFFIDDFMIGYTYALGSLKYLRHTHSFQLGVAY